MNPELWGRVKTVFEEAADLSPEEQAEFVRNRSEGDGEVEEEVLLLLGAHSSSAAFLEVRPRIFIRTWNHKGISRRCQRGWWWRSGSRFFAS